MGKENLVKKVYSKHYLIFLLICFIPLMWKILEIALLSSFENGLKILGQVVLFSIIFKIFEETITTPLYRILAKDKSKNVSFNLKMVLLCVTVTTVFFTMAIFFLIDPIMKVSKVPNYIFEKTSLFMKIYVFSCGLGVVVNFLYLNSVIQKDTKQMIAYLLLKSIITAGLIVVLVPNFAFGMGVNGIATTELIINVLSLAYLLVKLKDNKDKAVAKVNKKEYIKLMCLAFVETSIRNIFYYFVVLVLLNVVDNQDIYCVANEYIWAIMLVPTLAQNALIKQELSNDLNCKIKPYFLNTTIICCYMFVVAAASLLVFKYVYNLKNYMDYFLTVLELLPCYVVFAFDAVAESFFVATGKLHYVLIQTIITNVFVYLPALILYLCGVWVVSFQTIILLFSVGVVIASAYTIIVYCIESRKKQ